MRLCCELHDEVFQSKVDARWYQWKYRPGLGLGSGAFIDQQLVAHCGGVARMLWVAGQRTSGLQIGDVMVQPQWRGVMTRRGPFYYVSQHFYERQLGANRPFQLGFGFPGARHLKLAVAVKLLRDRGSVQALHWNPTHRPVHCQPGSGAGRHWHPTTPTLTPWWAALGRTCASTPTL